MRVTPAPTPLYNSKDQLMHLHLAPCCPSFPSGDTIDRLSTVHELLAEAADWPRVVHCAQVVPVLLHIYFSTVVKVSGVVGGSRGPTEPPS